MYKLSDEVIAEIAKLVQLAIITGTDVVDNLRMIRVQESESLSEALSLTPEYRDTAEKQVQKLLSELSEVSESDEHNTVGD